MKILHILSEVYYEKDANQEMVTPLQVGLQLIEWTDPNKALKQNSADWSIHLDLAIDLVKSLFKSEESEFNGFSSTLAQVLHRVGSLRVRVR